MLDQILAVLALACLVGFMGILGWFVPDIDLLLVILFVLLLAIYDFFVADRLGSRPDA